MAKNELIERLRLRAENKELKEKIESLQNSLIVCSRLRVEEGQLQLKMIIAIQNALRYIEKGEGDYDAVVTLLEETLKDEPTT